MNSTKINHFFNHSGKKTAIGITAIIALISIGFYAISNLGDSNNELGGSVDRALKNEEKQEQEMDPQSKESLTNQKDESSTDRQENQPVKARITESNDESIIQDQKEITSDDSEDHGVTSEINTEVQKTIETKNSNEIESEEKNSAELSIQEASTETEIGADKLTGSSGSDTLDVDVANNNSLDVISKEASNPTGINLPHASNKKITLAKETNVGLEVDQSDQIDLSNITSFKIKEEAATEVQAQEIEIASPEVNESTTIANSDNEKEEERDSDAKTQNTTESNHADNTATNNNTKASVDFSDVPDTHWAKKAVEHLYQEEIMMGYGNANNEFGITDAFTRRQMTYILARLDKLRGRSFDLDDFKDHSLNYVDVKTDDPARREIAYVTSQGYMTGVKENATFLPDAGITRDMLGTIVARFLEPNLESAYANGPGFFVDNSNKSAWYFSALRYVYQKNLMLGSERDGKRYFGVNQLTDRGEVAVTLSRAINNAIEIK